MNLSILQDRTFFQGILFYYVPFYCVLCLNNLFYLIYKSQAAQSLSSWLWYDVYLVTFWALFFNLFLTYILLQDLLYIPRGCEISISRYRGIYYC